MRLFLQVWGFEIIVKVRKHSKFPTVIFQAES